MEDWKKKIAERDGQILDWMKAAMERDDLMPGETTGPDVSKVDPDADDAPTAIRLRVGALDKESDRLNELRKAYPDAQPIPDDPGNYVYTDKDGTTRRYNNPNYLPFSAGDWASIAPEIGETAGSVIGSGIGAVMGAAGGSTVPVVGTAAGGVTGAIGGAGIGGTIGRETTQRGLAALLGLDDTRTGTEQAIDMAQTFGINAAGEGAGRAVAKGGKMLWDAGKTRLIGGVATDAPEVIQKRVEDFRAIGAEPTPGMVTGSEKQALKEHATKNLPFNHLVEARIKDAYAKQGEAWDQTTAQMLNGRPAMSKAELGQALKDQTEAAKNAGFARSKELYDKIPGTAPASITSTADYLKNLSEYRARMGQFDNMTEGAQADRTIAMATSIVGDAQSGGTMDTLKGARTKIGEMRRGETDPIAARHLDGLYKSLTDDIKNTAQAAGPDALQAFNKANNQYRRLVDDKTGFGKGSIADKVLNTDTDKIHDLIFKNRKDGGNTIAAARRNIVRYQPNGKEAWDDIGGSFVTRLGMKDVNGEMIYDTTTFLKNWNDANFSKEAKSAVFSGSKNAQYRDDLDRLARIGETMKRYNKHDNHSNTAKHQSIMKGIFSKDNLLGALLNPVNQGAAVTAGTFLGAGMMPAAVAGAGVLGGRVLHANVRQKLMTSPEVVNWMAGIPKQEMNGGLKSYMTKLRKIGFQTSDNALSAAINDYMNVVGYNEESDK